MWHSGHAHTSGGLSLAHLHVQHALRLPDLGRDVLAPLRDRLEARARATLGDRLENKQVRLEL
eukprot:7061849-Pyramimonas_sp.AAC.1